MIRRSRLLSVLATVFAGALGVISSTQTWLTVVLDDGAAHTLPVAGAAAIPVLTALSLAVLALGAALTIVGTILRFAFGALTVVIALALGYLTARVVFETPVSTVASTVTTATGISGADAVAELIALTHITPWPVITLILWVILLLAGVLILATAARWRGAGRRFRTEVDGAAAAKPSALSRPHDAIDSWDDLSRGDDPTA